MGLVNKGRALLFSITEHCFVKKTKIIIKDTGFLTEKKLLS